jgi:hypothetical protein
MESTKKKVGLFLPTELADALDHVASRVGKKQKWLVVGAALIRLLEASEDEQNNLIRQVKIADLPGGSFESLIALAKSRGDSHGGAGFEGLVAEDDADASRADAPSVRKTPQSRSSQSSSTKASRDTAKSGRGRTN